MSKRCHHRSKSETRWPVKPTTLASNGRHLGKYNDIATREDWSYRDWDS